MVRAQHCENPKSQVVHLNIQVPKYQSSLKCVAYSSGYSGD